MKKIVLVAGGSGGHLFSAIAVGEELISRGYIVHLITDMRCQKYINSSSKIIFHIIDLQRFPKSFLKRIGFFIELLKTTYQATKLQRYIKPEILVGFGGYPTVPSMFAAIYLKVLIVIHEQNSCIGKVNKFFARFAKKIALAYESTKHLPNISPDKIAVTGGIVRKNIRNLNYNRIKDTQFRLFVFGGSQGAQIFSTLIPKAIEILMDKQPKLELSITQQAPYAHHVKIEEIYSKLNINYELKEFFDNISTQYQNADLVIARSGASTIEELTYIGLPAIFIPLPSSTQNHQYYNAKLLADNNAGWCIEQNNIASEKLADKILQLINNRDMLEQASQNLLQRKKEGHKLLSDLIEELLL
jgi:UDP-N-acetylglucosamine--N-acetylmuramyl-(pentapeptide) pyrophosphoryl-undecaprenol N-acetylglucosamine transferase